MSGPLGRGKRKERTGTKAAIGVELSDCVSLYRAFSAFVTLAANVVFPDVEGIAMLVCD